MKFFIAMTLLRLSVRFSYWSEKIEYFALKRLDRDLAKRWIDLVWRRRLGSLVMTMYHFDSTNHAAHHQGCDHHPEEPPTRPTMH